MNIINLYITSILMAVKASSWKTTLPAMLFGMLGIFIVIGVIILATYLLNKITAKSKDKKDK